MRGLLLSVLILAACSKNNEPPPPSSGVPGAKPESGPKGQGQMAAGGAQTGQSRAAALFGQICQTCHGASGDGNGPMAPNLAVKPRNYTDAAWQASVTDDQIKEIIVKGGKEVGKSPMMPGNPELAKDPEELDALVAIIRGFGKK